MTALDDMLKLAPAAAAEVAELRAAVLEGAGAHDAAPVGEDALAIMLSLADACERYTVNLQFAPADKPLDKFALLSDIAAARMIAKGVK